MKSWWFYLFEYIQNLEKLKLYPPVWELNSNISKFKIENFSLKVLYSGQYELALDSRQSWPKDIIHTIQIQYKIFTKKSWSWGARWSFQKSFVINHLLPATQSYLLSPLVIVIFVSDWYFRLKTLDQAIHFSFDYLLILWRIIENKRKCTIATAMCV